VKVVTLDDMPRAALYRYIRALELVKRIAQEYPVPENLREAIRLAEEARAGK
jgi:hypothetical protein